MTTTEQIKAKCIAATHKFISCGEEYLVSISAFTPLGEYCVRRLNGAFIGYYPKNSFEIVETPKLIKVKCVSNSYQYVRLGMTYYVADHPTYLTVYDVYSNDSGDDGTYIGSYDKPCFKLFDKDEVDVLTLENQLDEAEKNLLKSMEEIQIIKEKIEKLTAETFDKYPLVKWSSEDRVLYDRGIDNSATDRYFGGMDTFKLRKCGMYENIGLYLTDRFEWSVEKDEFGKQVLVPTNKA